MKDLLLFSLAAFLVWECALRPALAPVTDLLPGPAVNLVKAAVVAGTVFSMVRWLDERALFALAGAAVVSFMSVVIGRLSEPEKNIPQIVRRANRGMPTPR